MKFKLFLAVFGAAAVLGAAETANGTVTANILNVRNRPDAENSTVVAKLKRGDAVTVIKQSGEWTEIAAPTETAVYAYAKFIENGKTTRDINLRSGAGIEYQSYGIIPAGTVVKTEGETKGDWIRIAPLSTMTCFVSSKFITLSAGKSDVPAGPEAGKAAAAAITEDPDTAQLMSLLAKDTAEKTSVEGYLMKVKSDVKAIAYALVTDPAKPEVVCYLFRTGTEAEKLLNRKVKVDGVSYKVNDWKKPVMEVTAITALQ